MTTHALLTLVHGQEAEKRDRRVPSHGFLTLRSLFQKRYAEQIKPFTVLYSLVSPFTFAMERKFREHTDKKMAFSWTLLRKDLQWSWTRAFEQYRRMLAKSVLQTLLAGALLLHDSAYAQAIVYHWDARPRLASFYISPLLGWVGLRRFLPWYTLKTRAEDVAYLQTHLTTVPQTDHDLLLIAFEDSLLRRVLYTVAELLVESFPHLAYEKKGRVFIVQLTLQAPEKITSLIRRAGASLLLGALGAVMGGGVYPGYGEYWGETLGSIVSHVLFWNASFRRPRQQKTVRRISSFSSIPRSRG